VEVTDGPYRGRVLDRTVWHTPGGQVQLAADMVELGHAHPEELCGRLWREYPITAGVSISTDDNGKTGNQVRWFRAARQTTPQTWAKQQTKASVTPVEAVDTSLVF
jgi:hypothetical protein